MWMSIGAQPTFSGLHIRENPQNADGKGLQDTALASTSGAKRQRSAERYHHARPIVQQLLQIGWGTDGGPRWRATLARFRLSRSQDQHRRLRTGQHLCH